MARPVMLGHRATHGDDGRWTRGDPIELDADALVRHAFVSGASGFGKTVFSKGIVEEAVLAGIPVIAVDFKGDLASLALTGPLARVEALRSVFGDEAATVAAEFEAGQAASGVDPGRAAAYAAKAMVRLFTPNSRIGRRVAMSGLPSFPDPPASALERDERDELIQALVLGFAHSMYGTPAAVKRNEPAVKVVEELCRWCADRGEPLEGGAGIARILDLVSRPPLDAMGGMSIDEYLPARDKQRLMQMLNSRLLGAERARYEGPRLSVETLLGDVPPGKVPLSVLYLGHSSDFAEQASVLGQLCADVYRWMRRGGGSSGVRLLLYVDELGGGDAKHAFYPSAPSNPPSKAPLNLLVRQGRSAGVAMLLATQNPMSVDVRGLGNINTWAIGRLTRKNDHTRIEDLLSRMPEGPQRAAKIVSQLPQGVMLTLSDALSGPEYVLGRWLYSIHRQLAPSSVAAITELMADPVDAERDVRDAAPVLRPEPPKVSEPPKAPEITPLTVISDADGGLDPDEPTEHGTTRVLPRHLREHEDTELVQTLAPARSAHTVVTAVRPVVEEPPDDDTDELLAETGVRPTPVTDDLGEETDALLRDTAIRPPRARRRRRPPKSTSETTWLQRDPTDDGESLTITFARPRPKLVSPGWTVRHEGQVWPITPGRGVTVGRSSLADARIEDRRISRLHVLFQLEGPNLWVRPLRAKNGTRVDGRPLDVDLRLEATEDSWLVELGDSEIVVTWTPAP